MRSTPKKGNAMAFDQILRLYLQRLETLKKLKASEHTLKDAFLKFLRESFPGLEKHEPILLEKHIPAIRVQSGYADALCGHLIFEFKIKLTQASRTEGKEELERYLLNQKHPEAWLGVLTDGDTLEIYAINRNKISDKPLDNFVLSRETPESVKLKLDVYLFQDKGITPTANDIVRRFGEKSLLSRNTMSSLSKMWHQVKGKPSAKIKFEQWKNLLALVYGSSVGTEELFLRHTYLAIFARIVAFTVLENRLPSRELMGGIIGGDLFRKMGFLNFVEEDFFAWVADDDFKAESCTVFSRLALRLGHYELSQIGEDVLKELYQEFVDPATRHDLGEFYTPDWLAEMTLREAGFPPDNVSRISLLDPACGSGTFLFLGTKLLRENGFSGPALVDIVLNKFAGLDVHPLAVAIAKTNIILSLGQDLHTYKGSVILPVYMANSLNTGLPEKDCLIVDVSIEGLREQLDNSVSTVFALPLRLSDQGPLFDKCLNSLIEFAKLSGQEENAIIEGFGKQLERHGVKQQQSKALWFQNLRLLSNLIRSGNNSVWKFILSNVYRPAIFSKRKFSFVVGNPPWLSYRYIKIKAYQQQLRTLAFRYGLISRSRRQLYTQIELATVFYSFCFENYLAPDGTIAFVLPRSILTGAKQHEGFNAKQLIEANKIIDCEEVDPLFNIPACVVIQSKNVKIRKTTALASIVVKGELPEKNMPLERATTFLEIKQATHHIISQGAESPYMPRLFQGASIVPRCLWFVRPPAVARTIDIQAPYLETDQKIQKDAKPPWKEIKLTGKVESDFLFATLLSKHLLPFGKTHLSLVALPITFNEIRKQWRLVDEQELVALGKIHMSEWLRKAKTVWRQHRKTQISLSDRINWQHLLSSQTINYGYKVLYGTSGTHIASCVIEVEGCKSLTVHGLPVMGFVADTKTYYIECESRAEAHYLCAILNAPLIDSAIKGFQTKGAFGVKYGKGQRDIHRRPFEVVNIPLYQPGEPLHEKLVTLSERCHDTVEVILSGMEKISGNIGMLRNIIRDSISKELAEIDQEVSSLIHSR